MDTLPPHDHHIKFLRSIPDTDKWCPKCERILGKDHFNKNRAQRDGLAPHCRECRKVLTKVNYEVHKEELNKKSMEHYWTNKEVWNLRAKTWHAANREEHNKRNLLNHQLNKTSYAAKKTAWRKANPHAMSVYHSRRRANKKAGGAMFTTSEWEQLLIKYDYTCLKCGRREPDIKITADHVMPISLGGSNSIDNIQPLCHACNSGKRDRCIDYRKIEE